MYHILPETKGKIIAIHIEDWMTAQNYKTILPHLKNRIEEQGTIRVFIELKNFKGVEILGVLKALPYALRYGKYVEKKAIVTDEEWVNTWSTLLAHFSRTKVRCFSSSQVEQAWEWLKK